MKTAAITVRCGTLSDSVTVTIYPLPVLTIPPTASTVESGETMALSFSCTNTESGVTPDVTELVTLTSLDTDIVYIGTLSSGTAEVIGWATTGTGSISNSTDNSLFYPEWPGSALYVNSLELNSITLHEGGNPAIDSNQAGNPELDSNLSPGGISPYVDGGIYLPVTGLDDVDLFGMDRGTSGWHTGAIQFFY